MGTLNTAEFEQLVSTFKQVLNTKLKPNADILERFAQLNEVINLPSGELLRTLKKFEDDNQAAVDALIASLAQTNLLGQTVISSSLITTQGQAVIDAADLAKKISVSRVVVGDGNGAIITPDPSMVSLVNEIYSGLASNPIIDPNNPTNLYFDILLPLSLQGTIREVGLITDDNKLLSVGAVVPAEKNNGESLLVRVVLTLQDVGEVDLFQFQNPLLSHGALNGREAEDSHPISAITGLSDSLASALEKSLGVNARIWPKDRDLQVGDVIPSAQETADGLPITHVIVDGNAYAISPLASGLVADLASNSVTISGNEVRLFRKQNSLWMIYSSNFASTNELNDYILNHAAPGCVVTLDSIIEATSGLITNKPITIRALGSQNPLYTGDDQITGAVKVTSTSGIGVEVIPDSRYFPKFSDGRVIVTGVDLDCAVILGPDGSYTDISKRAQAAFRVRESSAELGEYHVRSLLFNRPVVRGFLDGIDPSAGIGRNQDSYLHTLIKPEISACGRGYINKGSQNTLIEPSIVNCSEAAVDMLYKNSGLRVFGGTLSESNFSIKRDITSFLATYDTQFESWGTAGVLISHEIGEPPFPYGVNAGKITGKFIKSAGSEPAIKIDYQGTFSDAYLPLEVEGSFKCDIAIESDVRVKRGLVIGKNTTGKSGGEGLLGGQLINFAGERFDMLKVLKSGMLSGVNSPPQKTIDIAPELTETIDIIKVPVNDTFSIWWLSRYAYNQDRTDTASAFFGVYIGATQIYNGFGKGMRRNTDGTPVFTYTNTAGSEVTLLIKVNDGSGVATGYGGRAEFAYTVE